VPVVTLVDVPGFLPGVEQERGGIIRHGAKMLFAYGSCTTPKITVILRKAYGGSYLAMCSQEMGADMVFAWPTAEIAVMGAEAAVKILYRKEIAAAEDQSAKAAEMAQEYREKFASPYVSASNFYITDVIEPQDTRWMVALALRKCSTSMNSGRPRNTATSPCNRRRKEDPHADSRHHHIATGLRHRHCGVAGRRRVDQGAGVVTARMEKRPAVDIPTGTFAQCSSAFRTRTSRPCRRRSSRPSARTASCAFHNPVTAGQSAVAPPNIHHIRRGPPGRSHR
jgi:hypothetical protein